MKEDYRKPVTALRRVSDIGHLRGWISDADRVDPDSWFGLASRSGLTELLDISFAGVDHALIHVFLERWHPETSSFHLPWGEMTITLHDVAVIMGLRIDGEALLTPFSRRDRSVWLATVFRLTEPEADAHHSAVSIDLRRAYEIIRRSPDTPAHEIASVFLLFFLGSTLFVDKSTNKIRPWLSDLVRDHDRTGGFAWGTGVLAYLYRYSLPQMELL